jgi:hypothetical protein
VTPVGDLEMVQDRQAQEICVCLGNTEYSRKLKIMHAAEVWHQAILDRISMRFVPEMLLFYAAVTNLIALTSVGPVICVRTIQIYLIGNSILLMMPSS